jgi:AcrR family transcriptional regulator
LTAIDSGLYILEGISGKAAGIERMSVRATTTEPSSDDARSVTRRLGRPPRLNRDKIAAAAYELGLENVSPRAVAGHLQVSVTGLYHYIDGRDDLLRLAAEYSAAQLPIPADRGQHWAVWVVEWALHTRDSFVEEPALLQYLIAGDVEMNQTAERVEAVVGFLVRGGFPLRDALLVYRLTCDAAIGAAVELIRERNAAAAGRPVVAEYHRVIAQRPGSLPHIEQMLAERARPVDSLREALCVLVPRFARPDEDAPGVEAIVASVFDGLQPVRRDHITAENEPATSARAVCGTAGHMQRPKPRPTTKGNARP